MMGWGCPGCGIRGGWGFMGMLPGIIIFVALLIVIIVAVLWLISRGRSANTTGQSAGGHIDPLEIARRRLAAGEITTAEYEKIRDRIQE
ncbi:MAG: SHOCT domain-containing protein [Anaerolineae bacterium]|nr:SHOCT domain-containing protein [Anaerolineae bacterium]